MFLVVEFPATKFIVSDFLVVFDTCFFICCYWSLYQYKKQSFVNVAVFSTFTNISSSFTLLLGELQTSSISSNSSDLYYVVTQYGVFLYSDNRMPFKSPS